MQTQLRSIGYGSGCRAPYILGGTLKAFAIIGYMSSPERPSVKLVDVFVEHRYKPFLRPFGKKGIRWEASVALNLYDEKRSMRVAEWFYLIVRSPEQNAKPFKHAMAYNPKYVIVSDSFDLDQIQDEAFRRFSKVKPASWDDFYEQMKEYFLNEDDVE